MYISTKSSTRGQFFILHFSAQEATSDIFLSGLHKYAQTMPNTDEYPVSQNFKHILDKIKERTTDKYAQEEGEVSAILYSDEVSELLLYFMVCDAVKGY